MSLTQQITRKDKALRTHGGKGYWVLGNITIDGPNGNIIVKDTNANDVVTIDSSGITVNIPSTYSVIKEFINFKKASLSVGSLGLNRYVTGGTEVSDMIFRTYESAEVTRNTYTTMAIYSSLAARKSFIQISHSFVSGVFTAAGLNYAMDGKTGSLVISVDDTDGHGYMTIPARASDPSGAGWGALYFNTTTNKLKTLDGGTWRALAVV